MAGPAVRKFGRELLRINGVFVLIVIGWLAVAIFVATTAASVSPPVATFVTSASALLFSVTTATLVFFTTLREKRFTQLGSLQTKLANFPTAGEGLRVAYLRLLFSQIVLSLATGFALAGLFIGTVNTLVGGFERLLVADFLMSLGLYAVWLIDFAFFSNLPLAATYYALFEERPPAAGRDPLPIARPASGNSANGMDSVSVESPGAPERPLTESLTASERANLKVEEYKACLDSKNHHERTMWQLLSIFMAVAGVLVKFWQDAKPTNPNAYSILFVPLLLGIFTAIALWKHKFFWELDLIRAGNLEETLGFKREKAFHDIYKTTKVMHYVKSWDWAVIAVVAITAGIYYEIANSIAGAVLFLGFVDRAEFLAITLGAAAIYFILRRQVFPATLRYDELTVLK